MIGEILLRNRVFIKYYIVITCTYIFCMFWWRNAKNVQQLVNFEVRKWNKMFYASYNRVGNKVLKGESLLEQLIMKIGCCLQVIFC